MVIFHRYVKLPEGIDWGCSIAMFDDTKGYTVTVRATFFNSASEPLPAPFLEIAKQTASAKNKPLCDVIRGRKNWTKTELDMLCLFMFIPVGNEQFVKLYRCHVCPSLPTYANLWWLKFWTTPIRYPSHKTLNRSPCLSNQNMLLTHVHSPLHAENSKLCTWRHDRNLLLRTVTFHMSVKTSNMGIPRILKWRYCTI